VVRELTPELRAALAHHPDLQPSSQDKPADGDLARIALALAAEDEQCAEVIANMADHPAPERFGVVGSALLASTLLIVLQTYVEFIRNPDGTWSLTLRKKPTDLALLKKLVGALLNWPK